MDETLARAAHRSVRSRLFCFRRNISARARRRIADRTRSAFLPFAVRCASARRCTWPCAATTRITWSKPVSRRSRARCAQAIAARGQRSAEHEGRAVIAKVVLVDAGGTNIGSVRSALQRLGVDACAERRRAHDPRGIARDHAGRRRRRAGHAPAARTRPRRHRSFARSSRCWAFASACSCCSSIPKKPIRDCLGIVPGCVRKLKSRWRRARAAHGLEHAAPSRATTHCFADDGRGAHAYFVHSLRCADRRSHARDRRHMANNFPPPCSAKTSSVCSFIRNARATLGARVLRRFLAL